MKNEQDKIDILLKVINSQNPDKFLKSKFQDFCIDMFFSEDVGAFMLDSYYQDLKAQVEEQNIIFNDEHKDLMMNSFSFGIFIFYAYVDFCLKTVYITKRNMKRFAEKISNLFFEQFPKNVFDYYAYLRRNGNAPLEQESILTAETTFPFFKELTEFKFTFPVPPSDDPDGNEETEQENMNMLGISIRNAYSCFVNTVCLSFSAFLNFLNSYVLFEELGFAES